MIAGHYASHDLPKTNLNIPMPICKPPKESNTCTYTLADDSMNAWECSQCRRWWVLNHDTPKENDMQYCPFCGSKIVDIKIETIKELIESNE